MHQYPQNSPHMIPIDAYLAQLDAQKQTLQLQLQAINTQMSNIRAHYSQARSNHFFKPSSHAKNHQLHKLQPDKEKLQAHIQAVRAEIIRVQALKKQGIQQISLQPPQPPQKKGGELDMQQGPQNPQQYPLQPPFNPSFSPPSPYLPSQQPPQQPKKPKLPIWVWVIIVLFALGLCNGVSQFIIQSVKSQSTVTQVATSIPTTDPAIDQTANALSTQINQATPTDLPTDTPTPPPTVSTATLGGTENTFIAKFGQPSLSHAGTDSYTDAAKNLSIDVNFDWNIDRTPNMRAFGVTASPIGDNQTWSAATGKALCLSFLPSDATFVKTVPSAQQSSGLGLIEMYYSQLLANTLPASYFTDYNQHQVKPGTIYLVYTYGSLNSPSRIQSCDVDTDQINN